jgi:hypothetical protein
MLRTKIEISELDDLAIPCAKAPVHTGWMVDSGAVRAVTTRSRIERFIIGVIWRVRGLRQILSRA